MDQIYDSIQAMSPNKRKKTSNSKEAPNLGMEEKDSSIDKLTYSSISSSQGEGLEDLTK